MWAKTNNGECMDKKRIVLTGATGLLGSNLLFEILKRHLKGSESVEIIILGRSSPKKRIDERIKDILIEEGSSYLGKKKQWIRDSMPMFSELITCYEFYLDRDGLELTSEALENLKSRPVDMFFHIAALTDFRDSLQTIQALEQTNVLGTERVTELAKCLDVRQFVYVGSAYSSGIAEGKISPLQINTCGVFRNPYEASKAKAEKIVLAFAKSSGICTKVFRASTICGRLLEDEIGLINKFDVFYAWAAFFLRVKCKLLKDRSQMFDHPSQVNIRIAYNPDSGLNIIPADYSAKAIWEISSTCDRSARYNLANRNETPHKVYIPIMLKTVNLLGAEHVKEVPDDMNSLEKLYYKTVGKIYTPYILSNPMLFDIDNLLEPMKKTGIVLPEVNSSSFSRLMDYAKDKAFGVKI